MAELPLSDVAPVRVSKDTPNGLFFPHNVSEPPMLLWNWGGKAHLLRLEGEHAFKYGEVGPGYVARGTLVTNLELRVDLSSRYDALNKSDPRGALVLQDGQVSVIAVKASDPFSDEHEAPLWDGFDVGTEEEKVGFSRWSIIVRDGDDRVTLWSNADEEAVTE